MGARPSLLKNPYCRAGFPRILILVVILTTLIVPYFLFEDILSNSVDELLISDTHIAALAVLLVALLAADLFLPIPAPVIALFAGRLFGLTGGIAIVWIGLMLGSTLGYFLGRGVLSALTNRVIPKEEMERSRKFALKYGALGLVATRALPILAEVSVLGAGVVKYPFRKFLILMTLANTGVACAYVYLGTATEGAQAFLWILASSLILPLIVWGAMKVFGDKEEPQDTV